MAHWRRTEPARRVGLAALLFLASAAGVARAEDPAELRFARYGEPVATLGLAALRGAAEPGVVRVFEPYEKREVGFEALPFARVLDAVYGASWREGEELLFTCRDGYQPAVPVQRFLDHAAWLAFARPGAEGFSIAKLESGRIQRISLAPFYLVWENRDDPVLRREGDYGWPYQLVGVEMIRAAERFPKMAPPDAAPAQVLEGFRAFRRYCSRCHAMNGEGGSIGPELSGIAATRDDARLRSWIDDPSRFVPTARMPPLDPQLPERDATIDALVAYLRVMAEGARPAGDKGSR